MRRQYRIVEQTTTDVGVLDKSALVLRAVADGPCSLAELVERTGLPRATAYRLATALVAHRLLSVGTGAYGLGPWLAELASADPLTARAAPVLDALRAETGASAQLYRRRGNERVCVAASDVLTGLRDTVPVGARLPMTAGSAAQALLADEPGALPRGAVFTSATVAAVRRRGWAQSVAERAPGVASVSAPVRDGAGRVVAAVSVSGPAAVLGRTPGRLHGEAVRRAAQRLSG
jgi:DNA-binding IclR family transcriptional regulator